MAAALEVARKDPRSISKLPAYSGPFGGFFKGSFEGVLCDGL